MEVELEHTKFSVYGHMLDTSFKRYGNDSHDGYAKYEVNSHGLRGKKELGLTEGLAAGCSQTFGTGVPEKTTWPNLLSDKLKISISNIAIPGSSIQQIVDNVFCYVASYGTPKYIFLLLPPLWRYRFAVDGSVLKNPYGQTTGPYLIDIRDERTDDYPLVSKRPHNPHDLIPEVTAGALSLEALKHLIVCCRLAGVKLYISTWHVDTARILDRMKKDGYLQEYSRLDYIDRFDKEADYDEDPLCHASSDLVDLPEWHFAQDPGSHMGVHQHMHAAELFESLVKEEANG